MGLSLELTVARADSTPVRPPRQVKRLQAAADGKELPPFAPPKPDLTQGLRITLKVAHEIFANESFKQGMKRCFVKVGQAPKEDGTFIKYTSHDYGSILKVLMPEGSPEATETGTLATIAGGMDVAACDDEAADSGPDDDENEDE